MNPDTDLDPRVAAYLRSRGDAPAPPDLLDRARDAANAPPRAGWTAWLAPLFAGAALAGMAAVVLAVSFRAPVTATAGAGAGAPCPITVPDGSFRAPLPWPVVPPANYHSHWFGTADLWTMLDVDGEVWPGAAKPGPGQKSWWWSTHFKGGFEESSPAIAVTGVNLDEPAPRPAKLGGRATNGAADFGSAMLVGVDFPVPGCWELTASYKGHTLSYVVLVN